MGRFNDLENGKNRRFAAGIMALTLLFVMLFSVFFLAAEVDHECDHHDINAAINYASYVLHIGDNIFFGTKEEYLDSDAGKLFLMQQKGGVCSTLFGSTSILTLTSKEVWICAVLSVVVLIVFLLFYNKIFAVCFVIGKITGRS